MNFLPGELSGDAVQLPIGTVQLPEEVKRRLERGPGGGRKGVIAGLRPEHFEDASLVSDRAHGVSFAARIDVLESMGSEYYVYFQVGSEGVRASELEELALDADATEVGQSREGTVVVARLDPASSARQGGEAELWFDSRRVQLFDQESGKSLLAGRDNGQHAASSSDGGAQTPSRPLDTP